MKLELNLNIKLLVVQFPTEKLFIENHAFFSFIKIASFEEHVVKFICKGSELNEDIAYEIVDGFDLSYFVDYNHHNPRAYKLTALESFISAIQAKNFHWGDNPVKLQNVVLEDGNELNVKVQSKEWIEAESRTFYPEKCIICEIL